MQTRTFLNKLTMVPTMTRNFSAASIRDRFEEAYQARTAQLSKAPKKM